MSRVSTIRNLDDLAVEVIDFYFLWVEIKKLYSKFGDVIRARRRELDLTQERIAHRVNAYVAYIGPLESGKRHPSEKLMAKVADALGLDKRGLFFLANPVARAFLAQGSERNGRIAWNAFIPNASTRQLHKITDKEMEILFRVALMGEVRTAHDFLFVLKTIRHAL